MRPRLDLATVPAMLDPRGLTQALLHRPRVAAPLLGALAALGFEPLHLWPLMLLSLAGLAELVARADNAKRAALIGWLWGVGHFSLGNNWIATAFTYQAQMPAWLGWLGVFLAALYLAVYPALAALGAWHLRSRPAAFALAFGGCWIISEWLRGWVFTGYAWNPLGVALLGPFDGQGLAMLARWIGTYGLSGVGVLLGLLLRCALLTERIDRRGAFGSGALLLALLVPMVITGTIAPPQGRLPFTLVQPNIAQEDIENPAKFNAQFVKTAQLSLPRRPGERRLVLWPESGVPDYLREGYPPYFYEDTTFGESPQLARARIARVV
ncbi:MAG: apolipoprotein N-acyltransferase, partial [Novosphingobium sp.]